MKSSLRCSLALVILLGVVATSCMPSNKAGGPDVAGTMVAATIFVLQTSAAATQTALVEQVPTSAATPVPTNTIVPTITPTPGNPVVTRLTLCLGGPGKAYNVISSIKPGTEVELLGIASVPGWFIVLNPTYHNRCWIDAASLRLAPGFNTSNLQIFNPPPTPGPRETATPTP